MIKHLFLGIAIIFLMLPKVAAQDNYAEQIKKYIEKYYPLALEEQKKFGIPACITLAQGIHETDAGNSELMTKANNHFGIKCKSDWKGETFLHSDNSPNECFKKYQTAIESYKDHSEHLKKNPRYASLFSLSITDYAAWAIGLKSCGYATNPQYSVKLIKIIEDYHLQDYTYMAMDDEHAKNYPKAEITVNNKLSSKKNNEIDKTDSLKKVIDALKLQLLSAKQNNTEHNDISKNKKDNVNISPIKKMADSAKSVVLQKDANSQTVKKVGKGENDNQVGDTNPEIGINTDKRYDSGKLIIINGLKAFYAYKDEMLLKYAVKYKIRYAHLLELNDLPDAPLQANMPIYVEKKLNTGTHSRHTVKENENMQIISQEEGIQLKRLYALNLMEANEVPRTGVILELQTISANKPTVTSVVQKKKPNTKQDEKANKKQPDNEFVTVVHPKPQETDSIIKETVSAPNELTVTSVKEMTVKKKPQVLKEDTTAEDLSGLKADLDRVVYADNNKQTKDQNSNQPKAQHSENLKSNTKTEPQYTHTIKPLKKEAPKKAKTYTIKKGDTLSGIADKFDVTVKELKQWNNLTNANIKDGKIIKVQP